MHMGISKVVIVCLLWTWYQLGWLEEVDSVPVLQVFTVLGRGALNAPNHTFTTKGSLCLTGAHLGQSEEGQVSVRPPGDDANGSQVLAITTTIKTTTTTIATNTLADVFGGHCCKSFLDNSLKLLTTQ